MRIINVRKEEIVELRENFNKLPLSVQKEALESRLDLFEYVSLRGIVHCTFKIEKTVCVSSFPNGVIKFIIRSNSSNRLFRGEDSVRVDFKEIIEIKKQSDEDGIYSVYLKSNPNLAIDLFW